ncbi:TIGR02281 family clan AA aspartic protease [Phyllobacterium sp. 22229]|uniref:TIGR02281 family clan AA aspartic protease n=1 Tax=Phyllobacterium sp. 22229 TaxID=3453895 RepID=UPI003F832761
MLVADPQDRNGGVPSKGRSWVGIGLTVIAIGLALGGAAALYFYGSPPRTGPERTAAPAPLPQTDPALTALYNRLDIAPLPDDVAKRRSVATQLDILRREPCDWNARYSLAGELQKASYNREAANALIAYSHTCSPSNVALSRAADILYGLSDFDKALNAADEVVQMSPGMPQFHFLRGQIREDAKKYEAAIDDYYSTIGLADDPATISSVVFQKLSNSYAALGKYCEAMAPLQTWVSIDPAKNDTPRVQTLMKDFSKKGNCAASYATGSDRFATQGKNVIMASVNINGVNGTFIVDTGASFVAVSKAFADKAKLPLDGGSKIAMQTANGVSEALRTTVNKIRLGQVEANDVAAVVNVDEAKGFGDGIDGLLGRSFLSRFDVTFGAKEWQITTRKE